MPAERNSRSLLPSPGGRGTEKGPRLGFRLYLITGRHTVKRGDLIGACEAALSAAPRGAAALQLREKDLSARELYELALKLREVSARYGAPMLVNGRPDVALAANADGVHLPSDSIGANDARKLLGPDRLIGVSAHSRAEISRAESEGADFVVFGPVFDPISKTAIGPGIGIEGIRAACGGTGFSLCPVPIFAIGGITVERASAMLAMGAAGVAAIGAVLGADSPADAMRAMIAALSLQNAG